MLSLIESSDSRESNGNKDVTCVGLGMRLVKCGLPFTLIRNMDAL